jgi:hypothetical protein
MRPFGEEERRRAAVGLRVDPDVVPVRDKRQQDVEQSALPARKKYRGWQSGPSQKAHPGLQTFLLLAKSSFRNAAIGSAPCGQRSGTMRDRP